MTDDRFEQRAARLPGRTRARGRQPGAPGAAAVRHRRVAGSLWGAGSGGSAGRGGRRVGLAAVAAVAVVLLAVLLRTDALTVRDPGPVGRPSAVPGSVTGPRS